MEVYKIKSKSICFSKLIASEITSCTQAMHGDIVSKLQRNLEIEALRKNEYRFAQTPFSGIWVTRDFSYLPHDDPTD